MKLSANQQRVLDQAARILEKAATYKTSKISFTSPKDVSDYLGFKIGMKEREHFICLFLDSQHRLIESVELFKGTIDSAAIYPREVIKATLERNASAVILGHNHPSGLVSPSEADKQITKKITSALKAIDVRVLDHVIVGHGDSLSFADKGLI